MTIRQKEKIGGFLIFFVSVLFTWYIWNTALTKGYFLVKVAGFAPAAAVMGLALVLFPSYKEERIAKGEDVSKLQGAQLMTPRWWAVLIVALTLGFINIYLLGY